MPTDSDQINKLSNVWNAWVAASNAATTGEEWDEAYLEFEKDNHDELAAAPSGHPNGWPARRPN